MKTIVIANHKGGVGKTTVSSQLVHMLSEHGHSVVGIDFDSQCNFSSALRNGEAVGSALDLATIDNDRPKPLDAGQIGLFKGSRDLSDHDGEDNLIKVHSNLVRLASHSEGNCGDYCIIDTSPAFGNVVFGSLLAADYLLVPIELKQYSIDGIETVLEAFFSIKEHNQDLELLGLLPSRCDMVKQKERDALISISEAFASIIIPHPIKNRIAYEEAQQDAIGVSELTTKSGTEAAKEFKLFLIGSWKRRGIEMNKFTSTLDRLALEGKLDGLKKKDTSSNTSIDINLIKPDPDQPRREFDQEALNELASSIKEHGVLQDITVQPKNGDGQYLIVFGERRYRAALIAGLKTLNVVIKTVTDDLREVQLIENIQREDLSTMEIANSINQLIAKGMKRDEVAQKLGWNKHRITQYANVAKMPKELQDLASEGVAVRALNDLHKIWQTDEDEALVFIKNQAASNITRVSVEGLKVRIANNTQQSDTVLSRQTPSPNKSRTIQQRQNRKLAVLCLHGDRQAYLVVDKKPSTADRFSIRYVDDGIELEVLGTDVQLIKMTEL